MQIERRASQRFDLQLPVSLRLVKEAREERCLTQDVSAGGTLLYSDCCIDESSLVELIFTMPSEITFDGNLRVRCLGKVLRAAPMQIGSRFGAAIHFEHYEFLSDDNAATASVPLIQEQSEELSASSHVFQPRTSYL